MTHVFTDLKGLVECRHRSDVHCACVAGLLHAGRNAAGRAIARTQQEGAWVVASDMTDACGMLVQLKNAEGGLTGVVSTDEVCRL